ncbi:uncharacterized protein LOC100875549 [Megachile rotundata]|uniref:uncharacterized protein LOC100875549 n=1 Tax=Megachile rotundata TaxID=143995 RepID=UPI000614C607|nr:PREDICTED: odorant receptor 24a-like [Megachile rotundata]
MFRNSLRLLGVDPYQDNMLSNFIIFLVTCTALGMVIPTFLGFHKALRDKDMDALFESLPYFIASSIGIVKLANLQLNKANFRKLLNMVADEWENLKLNNELKPLEDLTKLASTVARIYRTCILSSMTIFLSVTLLPSVLDVILPLNETRPRQQLFNVEYLFFDKDEYYYSVYLQLSWSTFVIVMVIGFVDSLYIIIIHHSSGLFAVCGEQIKKVTEMSDAVGGRISDQIYQCKRCMVMHEKALQFYEILKETSTKNYFFQVGLNMMGISVQAVLLVSSLDKPDQAMKAGVLLISKQFHLFVVSLPGQVLLDHCAQLAKNIYCSKWYRTPLQIQKMIKIMQIKANRPCALTAGGLYEMSIENFGSTLKSCMSYVTMLLSLKE